MFVDLCDWISAELHYHRYFSECSYAVRRVVVKLAKAVDRNGLKMRLKTLKVKISGIVDVQCSWIKRIL